MGDAELEAAIDTAGREKVFALVSSLGWSAFDAPPKWVWWQACYELSRPTPTEEKPE